MEVKAGRYAADVVEAVLGAAGHRGARRREGPAHSEEEYVVASNPVGAANA